MAENYNGKKFPPIFYCKRCRRLEDGAHRLMVCQLLGIEKIDVQVSEVCIKAHKKNEGYLHQFEALLNDAIKNGSGLRYKREVDWVKACEQKKWNRFRNLINFNSVSVLDVGCQIGYTCFEAWRAGATYALGIDKRRGVIGIARKLKALLDITNRKIEFWVQPWEDLTNGRDFDVVFCMGLIHYFKRDAYDQMLAKLACSCQRTLVLELRLRDGERCKLLECGEQTLPTAGYLKRALDDLGFNIKKTFVQRPNERGLWIAERGN